MKKYLKDLDEERNNNPCTNCNHGFGSYSNGEDMNGKYIEITSCKDDGKCTEYEQYAKKIMMNIVEE